MIVDAARDRRIYPMLLGCHLDQTCLYTNAPAALEGVAPYLVRLDHEYHDTHKLLEHGWDNSWGVMLRCDTRMERLRSHLRRLLMVHNQAGKRLLFRYYDPRVLRVFLPTCREIELREVFGPIECFWCENESPESMLEFRMQGGKLMRNAVPLV